MGIVKCTDCGCYMNDDEVVWIEVDDTHDAPYCITCSPEQPNNDTIQYED